jgi:glycerophosphoryl diester phosphodiesterase
MLTGVAISVVFADVFRRLGKSTAMDKPNDNAFFRDGQTPLVLGHRGVPRAAQENTIAAFEKAVEAGLDGVELDVYLTSDNKVVVFHDDDAERLTGTKGCICDMTWDEVSKLRVQKTIDATGEGDLVTYENAQPIPLLEEVLDRFSSDLLINIELKAYKPMWSRRHLGRHTAEVIRKTGTINRVIATSFDFFMLRDMEGEFPGIHSGFAYDDGMSEHLGDANDWYERTPAISGDRMDINTAKDKGGFMRWVLEANLVGRAVGSTVIDCEWTTLDNDSIEKFHNKGMAVGTYCLNPYDLKYVEKPLTDAEEYKLVENLMAHKVDWMETDDPEKLRDTVAQIEG